MTCFIISVGDDYGNDANNYPEPVMMSPIYFTNVNQICPTHDNAHISALRRMSVCL